MDIDTPPSFCVAEHHDIQEPKFRVMMTLPGQTSTRRWEGPMKHPEWGRLPYRINSTPSCKRRRRHGAGRPAYFSHPYKTMAIRPSSPEAAHIWPASPFDKRPLGIQNAGPVARKPPPPPNWGLVAIFLPFLARRLLSPASGAYADGVFCAERSYVARRGF